MFRIATIAFCSLLFNLPMGAQDVELGAVDWVRDFDLAQEIAQQKQKPIFLLFQEVPGCMTCRNYGSQVLSHPFIVEAIEEYFVPLAIFNNVGGKDLKTLQRFNEPSWNNPVVRFLDSAGKDMVERLNGDYTAIGLIDQMVRALEVSNVDVPSYLLLARDELAMTSNGIEEVTMRMFCFWTGEKVYGQISGVAHTEAGFMDGHEVVRIRYDPSSISLEELVEKGKQGQAADAIYCHSADQKLEIAHLFKPDKIKGVKKFRRDEEVHYYLHKSDFKSVPMSKLQRTRINAELGKGNNVTGLLSPKQTLWVLKSGATEDNTQRYSSEDWKEILLNRRGR